MKHTLTMSKSTIAVIFALVATLTACHRQAQTPARQSESLYIDSIVNSHRNPDSLQTMLTAYKKTKNLLGVAVSHRALGRYYRDNSLFDIAIEHHRKSVEAAEQAGDTAELVRCLNNLATDYRRVGMLDMASEEHYRALNLCMQYSDKTSDEASKNYTVSLNGLGNVYLQLGNNELADSIFRVALATETRLGSELGQAINLANLGAVYEGAGQTDSALVYYQRSFEKNKKANSTVGMGLCHTHIGNLYERQHHFDKAIAEYQTAYDLLEKSHDIWHWLEPCLALANISIKQGNIQRAEDYLEQAFKQATAISSKEHLARIHHIYYILYEREGKTAQALDHYRKYDLYNDSTVNMHTMNQIQNLRIKTERQRSNDQLQRAKEDARQERSLKVLAFSLLVAILIIGALLFAIMSYVLRSRSRERLLLRHVQTTRERFFTNITHEFRTPLSVILGLAQQVGQPTTNREKVQDYARAIERQGSHLLDLINQLLDISKVKTSIGDANWQHGNVIAFIRMGIENYRQYAQQKRIELIYTPEQNMVKMDFVPDYMEKILVNLLSNSFKHTEPQGRVHVETSLPTPDTLCLVVSDNGSGIPKEALPHIFEAFYQAEGDTQSIGTGIGLSLVRQIVEAMNGTINCKSERGKGTTMTVTLPLRHGTDELPLFDIDKYKSQSQPTDDDEQPLLPDDETTIDSRNRVLIVEDNSDVAFYIGELLDPKTYSVFYAKDGDEGIAKARDIMPDVIITDLMMPGTNGLELCRRVRASELLGHIPIIVITAKSTEQDRVAGLEAGADAYLVKPFNQEELQVRMTKLLQQRRQMREYMAKALREEKEEQPAEDMLKPADRDFIRKLKEVINMQMKNNQVDAETIASHMFVSRAQLNRKLQAITGQTTSAFVLQMRMSHAKRLLTAYPEMPISEVAQKCGYDDLGYFSRSFKQTTGQTPTQFRKTK